MGLERSGWAGAGSEQGGPAFSCLLATSSPVRPLFLLPLSPFLVMSHLAGGMLTLGDPGN